jgi:DNA-nicking Smr family endonuclease
MKRTIRPEEAKLWSVVTGTVRLARASKGAPPPPEPADPNAAAAHLPLEALITRRMQPPEAVPEGIEPKRKRRIARDREPIASRLDLHGMDQVQARAALHGFILRAHANGARAVLVITGKGMLGDGVLRRRVPEWLAESPVRAAVAGVAHAERHHGGEGALYVALRRKVKG